jgi:hypothetical protein
MQPIVDQGGSNSTEPVAWGDGGLGVSVQEETVESSSATNWHTIILVVLAFIWASLILFGVAYAIVARAYSHKHKSTLNPKGAVTAVPVGEEVENEGEADKST